MRGGAGREQTHCCIGNICSQNIFCRVENPNRRSLRRGKVNLFLKTKTLEKCPLDKKQNLLNIKRNSKKKKAAKRYHIEK